MKFGHDAQAAMVPRQLGSGKALSTAIDGDNADVVVDDKIVSSTALSFRIRDSFCMTNLFIGLLPNLVVGAMRSFGFLYLW